jgi:hypothetical protein
MATTAARLEALEHAESATSFCVFEFEEAKPVVVVGGKGDTTGGGSKRSGHPQRSVRRHSPTKSDTRDEKGNPPPPPQGPLPSTVVVVAAVATQPVVKMKRKMRGGGGGGGGGGGDTTTTVEQLPETVAPDHPYQVEEKKSLPPPEKGPKASSKAMMRDISLSGIRSELGSEFNSQGLWTGEVSILKKAPSVSLKGHALSKTLSGPGRAVATARSLRQQMKEKGREEKSKLAGASGSDDPQVMMAEIELLHHIMQREQTLESLRNVVERLEEEYGLYSRKCREIAVLDRKRKLGVATMVAGAIVDAGDSPKKKQGGGGGGGGRRDSTRNLVQVDDQSHPDRAQFQEICGMEDGIRSKQRVAAFLIQNARENGLLVIASHQRWRARLQKLLSKTKRTDRSHTVQPFLYAGVPYLLKMMSDLAFVERSATIKQWLGFDMAQNPMAIPATPWTSYQHHNSVLPHDTLCNAIQSSLESIALRRIQKRNAEEGRNLRLRINGIVRSLEQNDGGDAAAAAREVHTHNGSSSNNNSSSSSRDPLPSSHLMSTQQFESLVAVASAHRESSVHFVSTVVYNFVLGEALQKMYPKAEAEAVYTHMMGIKEEEDPQEREAHADDDDDDDVLSDAAEEELALPMIVPDIPLVDHLDADVLEACRMGVHVLENEQRLHQHLEAQRKKEEFDMKHGYDPFVVICEFESLDHIFQTYMERQPEALLETVKRDLLSRQQAVHRQDEVARVADEPTVETAAAAAAKAFFITASDVDAPAQTDRNIRMPGKSLKFNRQRIHDRLRDENTSQRVMVTRDSSKGCLQGSTIVRKKPPSMSRLMIVQRRKDAATHIQSLARARHSQKVLYLLYSSVICHDIYYSHEYYSVLTFKCHLF